MTDEPLEERADAEGTEPAKAVEDAPTSGGGGGRSPADHGSAGAQADPRGADLRLARSVDAEGSGLAARRRSLEGRGRAGAGAAAARLRAARGGFRPAAGGSRRRLPDRHAARPARVRAAPVPRAHVAEAVGAGARDAGRHRLPPAGHGARDRRDPRRQHLGRPQHADRPQAGEGGRPQAGRRPAVHVRHDPRLPRQVRPQRPVRSAQGRGSRRRARLRSAVARRADAHRAAAGVRLRRRGPEGGRRRATSESMRHQPRGRRGISSAAGARRRAPGRGRPRRRSTCAWCRGARRPRPSPAATWRGCDRWHRDRRARSRRRRR